MTAYCPRCNFSFTISQLTEAHRKEIWKLRKQHMLVIKYLSERKLCSVTEAKAFSMHLNTIHGTCHKCHLTNLAGESILCPRCNSLNLNWDMED